MVESGYRGEQAAVDAFAPPESGYLGEQDAFPESGYLGEQDAFPKSGYLGEQDAFPESGYLGEQDAVAFPDERAAHTMGIDDIDSMADARQVATEYMRRKSRELKAEARSAAKRAAIYAVKRGAEVMREEFKGARSHVADYAAIKGHDMADGNLRPDQFRSEALAASQRAADYAAKRGKVAYAREKHGAVDQVAGFIRGGRRSRLGPVIPVVDDGYTRGMQGMSSMVLFLLTATIAALPR